MLAVTKLNGLVPGQDLTALCSLQVTLKNLAFRWAGQKGNFLILLSEI